MHREPIRPYLRFGIGLVLALAGWLVLTRAQPPSDRRAPATERPRAATSVVQDAVQRHPEWVAARYRTQRRYRFGLWFRDHVLDRMARAVPVLTRFAPHIGLVVLAVLLAWLIHLRFTRTPVPRTGDGSALPEPAARVPTPDVYLAMAQQTAEQGAWRAAIRNAYRALALAVAQRWQLDLDTRTGRELLADLRRYDVDAQLQQSFHRVYLAYERTWFGGYPAEADTGRAVIQTVAQALAQLARSS